MTTLRLFLGALILTIVSSCSKDLELPSDGKASKIVILGELTADSSIYLRLGQSLPLTAGNTGGLQLPQYLQVTVQEAAGNTIALSGAQDDLSPVLHTIPFTSPETIAAGKTYMIHASHAKLGTAEANVTIPSSFSARVTDTASVYYINDSVVRFDIEIIDNSTERNYYEVEAIQQPADFSSRSFTPTRIYTNDHTSDNLINGDSTRLSRRVLIQDVSFNGHIHRLSIFIPQTQIHLFPDVPVMLALQVKSISLEYYNFLQAYDQYDPQSGFSVNAAQVRLQGNVTNGLGMVGGVYRHQFTYVFP
jgi:hypothetical protein